MRAIVITRPGGPEVLELREVPTPTPARGEVRVRVHATAINRADLLQRLGVYPAPPDAPADIPGLEYAGEIDAVGEGVVEWKPGDRVLGLVGGGSYAESLVTPARTVSAIPAGLPYAEAAAVPEAFITAYDAMVAQAGLAAGETVLINAVASGVGTAAVQIARAVGARAIGTARTAAKLDRARELGLDTSVVVEGGRFADEVLRRTAGRGVDVVLELVGGAYLAEDLACMAPRARLILVGLLAGPRCEIDLATVLRKRLEIRGTVLRARPLEEKIAARNLFDRHLAPLFEREALIPIVDRVLPLERAAEAHAWVAGNQGYGKTVLSL
jgi:putative PIG3 family NAD(P)H quinone oxidoreductase